VPWTPTEPPGEPSRPATDLDRTQSVESLAESAPRARPARRPPPPPAPPPHRAIPWAALFATALLFLAAGLGALSLYLASAAREAERRAAALDDELITVRRLLTEAESRAEGAALDRDSARAAAGRGATPRAAILVELGPESSVGEGGGPELELDLARDRPPVVLVLRLGRRPIEAGFRAEILDVRGERVWRSEPLRREASGRFVLVLPAGSLERGRHELRLLGGRDGEERPLLGWHLQVVSGP
jgi:hypothetical protein